MTKKLLLLPSVLLGAMLIATPAMAQATPAGMKQAGTEDNFGEQSVAVWVDEKDSKTITYNAPAGESYRIAVIATEDAEYKTPFGDLSITGSSSGKVGTPELQFNGFRYANSNGATAFAGLLKGNSIKVSNSSGYAFGAAIYGDIAAAGSVDIGLIDVKSTVPGDSAYGATGIFASNLLGGATPAASSKMQIGTINVNSASYGTGVELAGTAANSLLSVDKINVNSGGAAFGIAINNAAAGKVAVGTIDADSKWKAAGVVIGGNADDLVLRGDINVKGVLNTVPKAAPFDTVGFEDSAAFGIVVGGTATITLENDVTISTKVTGEGADAVGILSGGVLTLDVNKYALNVKTDTKDGWAEDIVSGDGINLTGSGGSLTAGFVSADGDINVAVHGKKNELGLGNAVTVKVDGVFADDVNLSATEGGFIHADVVFLGADNLNLEATKGGRIEAVVDELFATEGVSLKAVEKGTMEVAVNMANVGLGFLYPDRHTTIEGAVTFIAYGEIHESEIPSIAQPVAFATVIGNDAKFVNRAIFTGYEFERDANGKYTGDMNLSSLKYANMKGEYLVAGAIHNRLTGYNMVRDRFISGSRGAGYRGQVFCDPCAPVGPCDEIACNPCDPCGTFGGRGGFGGFASGNNARNTWVNYVGRGDSYGDWTITSNGVQLGSDLFRTSRTQFGVIFGYEGGKAERVNTFTAGTVDSKDTYLGIYGARVLRNGVDVRFVYNYGWQKFDMYRDWFDGNDFESNFKGRTHEINFELGKRYYDGAWSIRPYVGTDFYISQLRGAEEEQVGLGSDLALTYDKMRTTQIFVRPGIDLRLQGRRATFNTGMSYAFDVRNQKYETGVSATDLAGLEYGAILRGPKMGGQVLMFNVGGDLRVGRALTVFGGYDMQAAVDRSGGAMHAGHIGGAVRW